MTAAVGARSPLPPQSQAWRVSTKHTCFRQANAILCDSPSYKITFSPGDINFPLQLIFTAPLAISSHAGLSIVFVFAQSRSLQVDINTIFIPKYAQLPTLVYWAPLTLQTGRLKSQSVLWLLRPYILPMVVSMDASVLQLAAHMSTKRADLLWRPTQDSAQRKLDDAFNICRECSVRTQPDLLQLLVIRPGR